ncbi:DUF1127 domain-containing protein [Terrarubrum flagellatum]|uniref:DUF1127 domain-containing protein n=1 Tax=Terrirubrum flagellatum TaxID=2895980 RepID=UPI0031456674
MLLATIIRRINEWATYRRYLRELAELSDRALADVGIDRANIKAIAWRNARAA